MDKPLNLAARLRDRLGIALGDVDPRFFATKKRLVLDASRAAFYELEPLTPALSPRGGEREKTGS